MFEIGIFWVIALAIGYSGALWFMGRHGDVLHGDFVHAEQQPEPIAMQGVTFLPVARILCNTIKQQLKDAAQI